MTMTQVRKIGPTRRSVSGSYIFQGHSQIDFESTLERDFLIRHEYAPNILDIIAQPCEIPFRINSKRIYKYTPDYLVYFKLGENSYHKYPKPLLVEVKPMNQLLTNWRDWSSKYKAAISFAKEQGWSFRIFNEARIHDQLYKNARFLEPFSRMHFCEQENSELLKTIREMGCVKLNYVLNRHYCGIYTAQGIAQLWQLIAKRFVSCNMQEPLNENTIIWMEDL